MQVATPTTNPNPAQTPDKNMNTSLVLTKAAGEVARKIDQAIDPKMLTGRVITGTYTEPDYGTTKGWMQFGDYMNFLFYAMITVAVITWIWEMGNLIIDSGTSEDHKETFIHRLFSSGLLKKTIKLAILMFFGVATWGYLYRPSQNDATYKVAGIQIINAADVKETADPIVNLMKPINLIVAPVNVAPGAPDSTISGTIAKASNKLGAWHFARQAIETTAKWQATQAATVYWDSMHPAGTTPVGGAPSGDSGAGGIASSYKKAVDEAANSSANLWSVFTVIGNAMVSYGMSVVLLFMNFGLDVMIVRTLMFNAIYLLIAYKVAILILPLAFIAAYWHQWEGVLRGTLQIMIVTVISLNVLADMTAIVVSPEQVQSVITDANTQSLNPDKQAEMQKYAKAIYAEMTAGGKSITREQYMAKVTNDLGSDTNGYIFNLDATFWAPIRVFLLLTIMVTLVGKVGTVISDTIAGNMTYHRS